MKKIPKKQFDEVIRLSRKIWNDDDYTDAIKKRIKVAKEIHQTTGLCFTAIMDIIDCIIRPSGFMAGADNEMIYLILRVLGWEVVDEDKESESLRHYEEG
jgi:hypothetical protein